MQVLNLTQEVAGLFHVPAHLLDERLDRVELHHPAQPPDELDAKSPARRILFQIVPEEKTVKNRIHWDVRLAGADKDAVRATLEARGATFLWSASQGPHSWHTMADPEGNEFCIS